jgi:hypothetical protein
MNKVVKKLSHIFRTNRLLINTERETPTERDRERERETERETERERDRERESVCS